MWTPKRLFRFVDPLPLCIFRFVFGSLMLFKETTLYLRDAHIRRFYDSELLFPLCHAFSFPLPPREVMHAAVLCMLVGALCLVLGVYPRVASLVFGTVYAYLFSLDESYYNNHYYLISMMAVFFALVRTDAHLSLTGGWQGRSRRGAIPYWHVWLFKVQLGIVYFYGGIAKLNYDWLVRIEPPLSWFAGEVPDPYVPYLATLIAYGGVVFDLVIPFLLFYVVGGDLQVIVYAMVVYFHVTNSLMFTIGVFPWLMLCSLVLYMRASDTRAALHAVLLGMHGHAVWLDRVVAWAAHSLAFVRWERDVATVHDARTPTKPATPELRPSTPTGAKAAAEAHVSGGGLKQRISVSVGRARADSNASTGSVDDVLRAQPEHVRRSSAATPPPGSPRSPRSPRSPHGPDHAQFRYAVVIGLALFFAVQIAVPLRHLAYYPGEHLTVHWTEEGHKYAWHMKLREKKCDGGFFIYDDGEEVGYVARKHMQLTARQRKKLLSHPSQILLYANHLRKMALRQGFEDPKIYASIDCKLNGREPQPFIDPSIDLGTLEYPVFDVLRDVVLPLDDYRGEDRGKPFRFEREDGEVVFFALGE